MRSCGVRLSRASRASFQCLRKGLERREPVARKRSGSQASSARRSGTSSRSRLSNDSAPCNSCSVSGSKPAQTETDRAVPRAPSRPNARALLIRMRPGAPVRPRRQGVRQIRDGRSRPRSNFRRAGEAARSTSRGSGKELQHKIVGRARCTAQCCSRPARPTPTVPAPAVRGGGACRC